MKVKLMECWADSAWLCIFHFWKCVTQGIKAPFENKPANPFHLSWVSPCHSLSLSLSLFFSARFPRAQRLSEFTFLPRLLGPNREGALHLRSIDRAPVASMNRASAVSGALLAFCVNQGISASFSLLYFLSCQRRSSWGYPWILLGLDPIKWHPEQEPEGESPHCPVFGTTRTPLRLLQTPLYKIRRVRKSG